MDGDKEDGKGVFVGYCVKRAGAVIATSLSGTETRIKPGVSIHEGDEIVTAPNSYAHFFLEDGSRLYLSADTAFRIETFAFTRGRADEAAFSVPRGTFLLSGGRVAEHPDSMQVVADTLSLVVRAAAMVVSLQADGSATVTSLGSDRGHAGEVLVYAKTGAEVLSRPYQTARLSGRDGFLTPPMTMPSGVVAETYSGPGMSAILAETAARLGRPEVDDAGSFSAFKSLDDQLLERRFVERQVFPAEHGPKRDGGDPLLEDAFDGERFRLDESGKS